MTAVWNRDLIIVVGMGRSGSSALTGVLALCGAALPLEILPANYANPRGYWESRVAVEINDQFLQDHGSSWYDDGIGLQTRFRPGAKSDKLVDRAAALLRHGFAQDGPRVLKDPRISAVLPLWLAAASLAGFRPTIVHNFRRPDEVAASLARRDQLEPAHSQALWLKYNLFPERDARGLPRVFVSYDDLLSDWRRVVADCSERLSVALSTSSLIERGVREFLSASLRHHAFAGDDQLGGVASPVVESTYRLLRRAQRGVVDDSAFDEIRAEYIARHNQDTEAGHRVAS
jgi:hypothetical protein